MRLRRSLVSWQAAPPGGEIQEHRANESEIRGLGAGQAGSAASYSAGARTEDESGAIVPLPDEASRATSRIETDGDTITSSLPLTRAPRCNSAVSRAPLLLART